MNMIINGEVVKVGKEDVEYFNGFFGRI